MDFPSWFNHVSGGGAGGLAPAVRHEVLWAWTTIALSALIVAGYCVLAFNWYFRSKVTNDRQTRSALGRLVFICACCAAFGTAFYAIDMPWLVWRSYDVALLILAVHTWSFVVRVRGVGLVDERLARVAELEESAAKYREIAELLPHVVWTATADGRIDFSNRRWRDYVGGDPDRTWLDALHADDRQAVVNRWSRALEAHEPVAFEARLCGVVGVRTFATRATPIRCGDDVRWLGACADVEDQKRLAALRETQAKQKSFFLNALSHDLRSPLHNVLLNAQLLRMSPRDDQAFAESLDMIIENAVAAGELVTKLLELAKVGAEDRNVPEPVPLGAVLRQLARRFQPLAQQKGLSLTVLAGRGEGSDVTAVTDRRKLERIVGNLIENAIKYTSRGGISLELVEPDDASGPVVIRVHDTGIGIPHEKIPYLFDEFFQVNNYERDRSNGFGMGLAICRSLAHQLGGADVRLASTGPRGSCFEVVLGAHGADRGGRPGCEVSGRADPAAAGLCGV